MDRVHHGVILMRAGHGQNIRKGGADALVFHAETARDDDPAVFRHRLADCLQAFGLGAVEEAAGVHDHEIRAIIARRNRIALAREAA